jgi:hypothetical protein
MVGVTVPQVENSVQQVGLPSGPWDLDLSNDGELLALAVAPDDAAEPVVRVVRTGDGSVVAEWVLPERYAARGVVVLDKQSVVFVVDPYEQITDSILYRGRLDGAGELQEVRRYPPFSFHHGIVRDRGSARFAVLGQAGVEVFDRNGSLLLSRPNVRRESARAAFAGERLYVYGTVDGQVVGYEDGAEIGRWAAPGERCAQVLVTPDERVLIVTGTNHTLVYAYDLVDGRLIAELERLGPWVSTPDGSTVAVLQRGLRRFAMPGFREEEGDELDMISGWQAAWAYDVPMVAFGVAKDTRAVWLRP